MSNFAVTPHITGHQNGLAKADLVLDINMRGSGEVGHNDSPCKQIGE